jgi:hypothetical protein
VTYSLINKGWDELTTKKDITAERNAADMNKMKFAAGTLTVLFVIFIWYICE